MRGKPKGDQENARIRGITPAYAGKTDLTGDGDDAARDHPRVCGENSSATTARKGAAGSPPRMRGKHIESAEGAALDGITPAYAGKTALGLSHCESSRDHPRVCGENSPISSSVSSAGGSPPRMRGKPPRKAGALEVCGITPAYAGKTGKNTPLQGHGMDHPRVCGENRCSGVQPCLTQGSPPRMRGKPRLIDEGGHCSGITPAYAGKTRWQRLGQRATRDHPRVCGENVVPLLEIPELRGSPPRMRGKRNRYGGWLQGAGITPAYAGKTAAVPTCTWCSRDHPRVCGENRSLCAVGLFA